MEWHEDVRSLMRCDRRVDAVIHLAGVSRHDDFATDPQRSYEVNVTGTLAVLNYCQRVGARCVLASSSAIYRLPQGHHPLSEEAPIGPGLPYGTSKWLAEMLCQRQATDMGVQSVALRLFNVYGPDQHPSFLVPYVVDCLSRGRPISLRMPNAIRDFVYVDDAVDAFIRASRVGHEGFMAFNIGTGEKTRVIELVRLAEEVYGRAVAVDVVGANEGEPSAVIADISRAHAELGWTPRYDLRTGLEAMKAATQVERVHERR